MNTKKHLKISELAHLVGINKRTLHYYDDIGLFSPEIKESNGYRYYSLKQVLDLTLILSLKELDMPLKDIQEVLTGGFGDFKSTLITRLDDIDTKINKLNQIRTTISRQLDYLSIAEKPHMEVNILTLPEEYLRLSDPIGKDSLSNWVEEVYQFFTTDESFSLSSNEYGAMIKSDTKIENSSSEEYDYLYLTDPHVKNPTFTKKGGKYLSIVIQGEEKYLPLAYDKLISYSKKHSFLLDTYFYERILHETVQDNQTNQITEIKVRITN